MSVRLVAATAALALAVPVSAQDPGVQIGAPLAPPVQPLSAANAYLRAGTEVPLRLNEELTTKGKLLKIGQRFRMETSEPVVIQGTTVIPSGSPAIGEITEVRNKGMWGKSGHFSAQVRYLTVNGRQIRLTGSFDDKGVVGGIGATAVSAIVFLPAGFFMTGTSAKLPIGTPVRGYVDEDVPLTIPNAEMTPLVVAPAAPVQASPAPTADSPPSKGD